MFELSESDKPLADKLFAFEAGELPTDEIVPLFQELVDNGWAWKLQGFYGRYATMLIEKGLVSVSEKA